MRQPPRRSPSYTKFAVVIVRINIDLCLFGIAAIMLAVAS